MNSGHCFSIWRYFKLLSADRLAVPGILQLISRSGLTARRCRAVRVLDRFAVAHDFEAGLSAAHDREAIGVRRYGKCRPIVLEGGAICFPGTVPRVLLCGAVKSESRK